MSDAADILREVRPYIEYVARGFRDVPDGLAPMFYHTLSADGDRAEGKKLEALLARIDEATGDD